MFMSTSLSPSRIELFIYQNHTQSYMQTCMRIVLFMLQISLSDCCVLIVSASRKFLPGGYVGCRTEIYSLVIALIFMKTWYT